MIGLLLSRQVHATNRGEVVRLCGRRRRGCHRTTRGLGLVMILRHQQLAIGIELAAVRGDGGRHIPISYTLHGAHALLRSVVDIVLAVQVRFADGSGWGGRSSGSGLLLDEEVAEFAGHTRQMGCRVLAREGDGWLVEMLRERDEGQVVGMVPLSVVDLGLSKDGSGEGKRGSSEDGRLS